MNTELLYLTTDYTDYTEKIKGKEKKVCYIRS
jgi:hypothetical protein